MQRTFALAIAIAVGLTSPVFAASKSKSVSQSWSQSESTSNSNSSINQKDRAQAPGFGVGGGYCSDGMTISVPGGGFGFSAMTKMCRDRMALDMANDFYGKPAARQVGCENVKEFRSLPACVQMRVNKAGNIQRRDRKNRN